MNFGKLPHQPRVTLPQRSRDTVFPDVSGSRKEETLLICDGWEEKPEKQSGEEDKERAVEMLGSAEATML